MFLAWNYTLEAFFWIIVGGIALFSLTIFMARPKASAKSLAELDYNEGEINEGDSYSDMESNLESPPEIEELEPEEVAEAEFEAFVETLPTAVQSILSIRAAIAVLYGLLIMCFGFIDLEIDGAGCTYQNWVSVLFFFSCSVRETSIFLTSIAGGVALIYGINQESAFMSRWGGRLVATYCIFLFPDTVFYSSVAMIIKIFLTTLALIFSSDIFSFWKWSNSYEKDNIRYYQWFLEFMKGDRPMAARLLLYLLLAFFFWLSLNLIISVDY